MIRSFEVSNQPRPLMVKDSSPSLFFNAPDGAELIQEFQASRNTRIQLPPKIFAMSTEE